MLLLNLQCRPFYLRKHAFMKVFWMPSEPAANLVAKSGNMAYKVDSIAYCQLGWRKNYNILITFQEISFEENASKCQLSLPFMCAEWGSCCQCCLCLKSIDVAEDSSFLLCSRFWCKKRKIRSSEQNAVAYFLHNVVAVQWNGWM